MNMNRLHNFRLLRAWNGLNILRNAFAQPDLPSQGAETENMTLSGWKSHKLRPTAR